MSQRQNLSFGEFLKDIRLVVTSPTRRLALIQERGSCWGSLVLLIIPAYFVLHYVSGIYFVREPFPGYSFVLPMVVAALAIFLKLLFLHVCFRLLQWKFRPGTPPGTFAGLNVVFGYTGVPAILAMLMASSVFLLIPQEIGHLMLEVKAVGVSIMIALAIALFIWNLILVVLALRTVYPMRDIQIVAGFILGSALMWLSGMATSWLIATPHIEFAYVQPILSDKLLRFFASDPTSSISSKTKISVHVDRLAYRLRDPERFELVVFFSNWTKPADRGESGIVIVGPTAGVQGSVHWEDGNLSVGRIVGLPGDGVELVQGRLRINGQEWSERYLADEYQTEISIPLKTLGTAEYFILPENRKLIEEWKPDLVVKRDQILGREILSRWPLGWWVFRPSVFLLPQPVATSQTR